MKQLVTLLFFSCISFTLQAQKQLWGTVAQSNNYPNGFIYRTTATGDDLEIVHGFSDTEGRYPSPIIQSSNGKLYGLTHFGGNGQYDQNHTGGVLFEIDPTTTIYTVLYQFSDLDSSFPYDGPMELQGLTEAAPGVLYGSVSYGGLQIGHIFKYTIATHTLQHVVAVPTFLGDATNSIQGNRLNGSFFLASNGYLYSTTQRYSQCPIGQPNTGTIVRVNPANGAFSFVHLNPCDATEGYNYYSNFIESGGNLYAVAPFGGSNNKGVIYQFHLVDNSYTKKYDFLGGDSGNTPVKIIRADNNLFYGIATGGSPELPFFPNGSGILFEFDPVSNNFTKKIDFIYDNGSVYNVGQFPLDLIKSSQPNILYGVTPNGVFEYNTSNDTAIAKGRFALLAGVSINAASLIEAEVAPLSIPEVTKPKGILYPNPVTATLSLSGDFEAESISVYNTLGQKILLTKDRSIDVSQLSNGVYFITVTTTGGVWKDRFVKQ